jgi:hypothetical protein
MHHSQEDFMNNCVVRTVLSAVLGSGMGVMFGIFMGTMDTVGAAGAERDQHAPAVKPLADRHALSAEITKQHLVQFAQLSASGFAAYHAQGSGIGGAVDYQNQTFRQAFREMAKNTISKSR